MSLSYRRLAEDPPEGAARSDLEPRKAKAWSQALPRANADLTRQMIENALDHLLRQKLSGNQRLAACEELRPVVLETVVMLERQYVGAPLPLPTAKVQAAEAAERLHLRMAQSYRKGLFELCGPDGRVPMLKGRQVNEAVVRAAWHYQQVLVTAWRVYRSVPAGTWQGLHRIMAFARALDVHARAVEDSFARASLDVAGVYQQSLLMALANPTAYSQNEQELLWRISRLFAAVSPLVAQAPEGPAAGVPEDDDRGPGQDDAARSWIHISRYSQAVDEAIARSDGGETNLMLSPHSLRVHTAMLQRLKRAFGHTAGRDSARLLAGYDVQTVFGLSALHYHLSGQRDFDSFLRLSSSAMSGAGWGAAGSEARSLPRVAGTVLDQSLGGYRLRWQGAGQIRARVGELVGIHVGDPDQDSDWMVGAIRWLRYEEDSLFAGIELLSRRGEAIGLRLRHRDGELRQPMRAVQLHPLDGDASLRILAADVPAESAERIEVLRDPGNALWHDGDDGELPDMDVLLASGDYVLLGQRPRLLAGGDDGGSVA